NETRNVSAEDNGKAAAHQYHLASEGSRDGLRDEEWIRGTFFTAHDGSIDGQRVSERTTRRYCEFLTPRGRGRPALQTQFAGILGLRSKECRFAPAQHVVQQQRGAAGLRWGISSRPISKCHSG